MEQRLLWCWEPGGAEQHRAMLSDVILGHLGMDTWYNLQVLDIKPWPLALKMC